MQTEIRASSDSKDNPIFGARTGFFLIPILSRKESAAAWRLLPQSASRGEPSSPITFILKAKAMTRRAFPSLKRLCRMPGDMVQVLRFCLPGTSTWMSPQGPPHRRSVAPGLRMLSPINTLRRHRALFLIAGEPSIGFFRAGSFAPTSRTSTARCRPPTTTLSRSF